METETSPEIMAEIRRTDGYSELLRVCRAYLTTYNVKGYRTARTAGAEEYFLGRVEKFRNGTELGESDVMWTLGWDSAERI